MTDDSSTRRHRSTSLDVVNHFFHQLIAENTPSVPPPIVIGKPKPVRRKKRKRRNGIEGFKRESRRTLPLSETNGVYLDHQNDTNHLEVDHKINGFPQMQVQIPSVNQPSTNTVIYHPSPRRTSGQSAHSAHSAHTQSSIFSESNKIRCAQIGKILMDHGFISNQEVVDRAMDGLQRETDYDELNKEYLSMELIDSLHDDLYSETECCLYFTFVCCS